jgi:hypothetical protein
MVLPLRPLRKRGTARDSGFEGCDKGNGVVGEGVGVVLKKSLVVVWLEGGRGSIFAAR